MTAQDACYFEFDIPTYPSAVPAGAAFPKLEGFTVFVNVKQTGSTINPCPFEVSGTLQILNGRGALMESVLIRTSSNGRIAFTDTLIALSGSYFGGGYRWRVIASGVTTATHTQTFLVCKAADNVDFLDIPTTITAGQDVNLEMAIEGSTFRTMPRRFFTDETFDWDLELALVETNFFLEVGGLTGNINPTVTYEGSTSIAASALILTEAHPFVAFRCRFTNAEGNMVQFFSPTFQVTPGPASKIGFEVQPTGSVLVQGEPVLNGAFNLVQWAVPPVLKITDDFGNRVNGFDSNRVSLRLVSPNPEDRFTMNGDTDVSSPMNDDTFLYDLFVSLIVEIRTGTPSSGPDYRIEANHPKYGLVTSPGFHIYRGQPKSIEYSVLPPESYFANAIIPEYVVLVLDSFGEKFINSANFVVRLTLFEFGDNSSWPKGVTAVAPVDENGEAHFTNTFIDRIGDSYEIVADLIYPYPANPEPETQGVRAPIKIGSDAPATVTFINTQPSPIVAGTNLNSIVLWIRDQYGNFVSDQTITLDLSLASGDTNNIPPDSTLSGVTSLTTSSGIADFSNFPSFINRGTYTFVVVGTVRSNGASGSSNAFVNRHANGNRMILTSVPLTGIRNGPFSPQPEVTLVDQFNNIATSSSDLVQVFLECTSCNFVGDSECVFSDGVCTFNAIGIDTYGVQRISFTIFDVAPTIFTDVNIIQGPPTRLDASTNSISSAGQIFTIMGNLFDEEDNFADNESGGSGVLSIQSGPTGATFFSGDVNDVSASGNLLWEVSVDKPGAYVILCTYNAQDGSVITATVAFTNQAGSPMQLAVVDSSVLNPSVAAQTLVSSGFNVEVQDITGNPSCSGITDTLALSSSPSGAFSPSGNTNGAINTANCLGTFPDPLVINTAGFYTFTVSSIGGRLGGATVTSDSFEVQVGPWAFIQCSDHEGGTGGTPFPTPLTAQFYDAGGNTVVALAGTEFCIAFDTSSDFYNPSASLTGVLCVTLSADSSSVSFPADSLTIDIAGNHPLIVSSTACATCTSVGVSVPVAVGPAADLVYIRQPGPNPNQCWQQSFENQTIFRVADLGGNFLSTPAGSVSLSVVNEDLSSAAPITLTVEDGGLVVSFTRGVATFCCVRTTGPGSFRIQADAVVDGINLQRFSEVFEIKSCFPTTLSILTQPSSSAVAGVDFETQPRVQFLDSGGYPADRDAFDLDVLLESADSTLLHGTKNVVAGADAIVTFTNLHIRVVGTYGLVFSYGGGDIVVSSNTITVGPAPSATIDFNFPEDSTQGAGDIPSNPPRVEIHDQFGNIADHDSSTQVTIVVSGQPGILTGTTTVTASSGIANFNSFTTCTTGTLILVASSTLNSDTASTADENGNFIMVPGAPVEMEETQPITPTVFTVGDTFWAIFQPIDSCGNTYSSSLPEIDVTARFSGIADPSITHTVRASLAGDFVEFNVSYAATSAQDYFVTVGINGLSNTNNFTLTFNPDVAYRIEGERNTIPSLGGEAIESFDVTILDQFDNPVTAGTVTNLQAVFTSNEEFTSMDCNDYNEQPGASLTGTLSHTITGPTATLPGLIIDRVGLWSVCLMSASANLHVDFTRVSVSHGPVNEIVFVAESVPESVQRLGALSLPQVEYLDLGGNTVTGDTTTATRILLIDSAGNGATLGGDNENTAVEGVVSFSDLTVDIPGTYQLSANRLDSGNNVVETVFSVSFEVLPGAPQQLEFFVQPQAGPGGDPFDVMPIVRVLDAGGYFVYTENSLSVNVSVVESSPNLSGTNIVTFVNGFANFTDLIVDLVGDFTLRAFFNSRTHGTIQVDSEVTSAYPGPVTDMHFTQSPEPSGGWEETAAEIFSFVPVIRLVDKAGNLVTTENSRTVTISSVQFGQGADTLANLGGGTATQTAVGGLVSFNDIFLNRIGFHSFVFSSTSIPDLAANDFPVNIVQGLPYRVAFSSDISSPVSRAATLSGAAFDLYDRGGNALISTSEVSVRAFLVEDNSNEYSPSDLLGTIEITATGSSSFSDIQVSNPGLYQLNASLVDSSTHEPYGESDVSSSFVVEPSVPTSLIFSTQPVAGRGGETFFTQPVVHAVDSGGFLVTWFSEGTINLALSDINSVGIALTGSTSFAVSNGVASFSNLAVDLIGDFRLQATIVVGDTYSISGANSDITSAVAGPAVGLEVFDPLPNNVWTSDAGETVAEPLVVRLFDLGGNDADDTRSVSVSLVNSADNSATSAGDLEGTLTVTPVNGRATFTDLTVNPIGSFKFAVSLAGLDDIVVYSVTLEVREGQLDTLEIVTQPSDILGGETMDPTPVVRLLDRGGNIVSIKYDVFVYIDQAASPNGNPSASLSGNSALSGDDGTASFPDLSVDLVGEYTLIFGHSAHNVTSNPITVSVGALAGISYEVQPLDRDLIGDFVATGGIVWPSNLQPRVVLQDKGGNLVDGTFSVNLTLSTPSSIVDGFDTRGLSASPFTTLETDEFGNSLEEPRLLGTTLVSAVGGVAQFTDLAVDLKGTFVLRSEIIAEAGVQLPRPVGSSAFSIAVGPAAFIGISQIPTEPQGASDLWQGTGNTVNVYLTDAGGNVVTSDNSTQVTVSLIPDPESVSRLYFPIPALKGTLTKAVSKGVAIFTDLSVNAVGSNHRIVAKAPITADTVVSTVNTTSDAISIVEGEVKIVGVVRRPQGAVVGQAWTVQPLFSFLDKARNLVFLPESVTEKVPIRTSLLNRDGSLAELFPAFEHDPVAQRASGERAFLSPTAYTASSQGTLRFEVDLDITNVPLSTQTRELLETVEADEVEVPVVFGSFDMNITISPVQIRSMETLSVEIVLFDSVTKELVEDNSGTSFTVQLATATSTNTSLVVPDGVSLSGDTDQVSSGGRLLYQLSVDKVGVYRLHFSGFNSDGTPIAEVSDTFEVILGAYGSSEVLQSTFTSKPRYVPLTPPPSIRLYDVGGNPYTRRDLNVTVSTTATANTNVIGDVSLYIPSNDGVYTFSNVGVTLVGTFSLVYTVTDNTGRILFTKTSDPVQITSAVGTSIRVIQKPVDGVAGEPFVISPSITVFDQVNFPLASDSRSAVNVYLIVRDSQGVTYDEFDASGILLPPTLSGGTSLALTRGSATFTGLSIDKKGTYALQFVVVLGTTTLRVTSRDFVVSVGEPYQIVYSQQPFGASAKRKWISGTIPIVAIVDRGLNVIETDSETVVELSVGNLPDSKITEEIDGELITKDDMRYIYANGNNTLLTGTLRVPVVSGKASFPDIRMSIAGDNFTFVATANLTNGVETGTGQGEEEVEPFLTTLQSVESDPFSILRTGSSIAISRKVEDWTRGLVWTSNTGGPIVLVTGTVVVTTIAASGGGGGGGVGAALKNAMSWKAGHHTLLAYIVYLQSFIIPIEHNTELESVFELFKSQRVWNGNTDRDSSSLNWSNNLLVKLITLGIVYILFFVLPGYYVELPCVSFTIYQSFFIPIFLIFVNPLTESFLLMFEEIPVVLIIAGTLLLIVFYIAFFRARPQFNSRDNILFRWLIPSGRGLKGICYRPRSLEDEADSDIDSDDDDEDVLGANANKEEGGSRSTTVSGRVSGESGEGVEGNDKDKKKNKKKKKKNKKGFVQKIKEKTKNWDMKRWHLYSPKNPHHHQIKQQRLREARARTVEKEAQGLVRNEEFDVKMQSLHNWKVFFWRPMFERVTLYRLKHRERESNSFVYRIRSSVGHYFQFFKVMYQIIFIATALLLDGQTQLLALAGIVFVYLVLIFIFCPFQNAFLQKEINFSILLMIQFLLLLCLLRETSATEVLLGVVILQIIVVPIDLLLMVLFREDPEKDVAEFLMDGSHAHNRLERNETVVGSKDKSVNEDEVTKYMHLGRLYWSAGNQYQKDKRYCYSCFGNAVKLMQRRDKGDVRIAEPLAYMGAIHDVYEKHPPSKRARKFYKAALKLDPSNPVAGIAMADFYLAREEYDKVAKVYDSAILGALDADQAKWAVEHRSKHKHLFKNKRHTNEGVNVADANNITLDIDEVTHTSADPAIALAARIRKQNSEARLREKRDAESKSQRSRNSGDIELTSNLHPSSSSTSNQLMHTSHSRVGLISKKRMSASSSADWIISQPVGGYGAVPSSSQSMEMVGPGFDDVEDERKTNRDQGEDSDSDDNEIDIEAEVNQASRTASKMKARHEKSLRGRESSVTRSSNGEREASTASHPSIFLQRTDSDLREQERQESRNESYIRASETLDRLPNSSSGDSVKEDFRIQYGALAKTASVVDKLEKDKEMEKDKDKEKEQRAIARRARREQRKNRPEMRKSQSDRLEEYTSEDTARDPKKKSKSKSKSKSKRNGDDATPAGRTTTGEEHDDDTVSTVSRSERGDKSKKSRRKKRSKRK